MADAIGPKSRKPSLKKATGIQKVATRVEGLDEILHGGLPAGRVTLFGGGPGAGKSIFGLEFVYRGALSGDPGIFLSFEETAESIRKNTSSFGWDMASLEKAGKIFLMEGQVDPEVAVSGDFNLKGLLAIVEGKAREMRAKRIVIDALDVLMRMFNDPDRERQQVLALHKWLQQHALTAVLTTKNLKKPDVTSPYDYLDFMADCVIYLDQRIRDQVNTKRLQVVKYRGSSYGSNEYPFLITDKGVFFQPISDMWLDYKASSERISSGSPSLDKILGGGYRTGTCILLSGATGTGKTALAATFARAAGEKGEKVLYNNFEESPESMLAGMLSLGLDLRPGLQEDSVRILSVMPESMGIEQHLYHKITAIIRFEPRHLVVDAISACKRIAGEKASFDFLVRLIHFCKKRGITVILINQTANAAEDHELSGIGISSIIDTIIILSYKDVGNETFRRLQVKKSRGTRHSNKYHDFLLSDNGILFETRDGPAGEK